MIVDGMKRCSKCGELKPLGEFYKRTQSPDGLTSDCKKCVLERMSKYYLKNAKIIINKNLKYRSEHKEERNRRDRKFRANHKQLVNKRDRERYIRNGSKIIAGRKYYILNRERILKERVIYYSTPEGKANLARIGSKRRNRSKYLKNDLTLRQWNKILSMQNYICPDCKREFTTRLKPERDHIIPILNPFCTGLNFGNVQALCKSCNIKKRDHVYFMRAIYTLLEENLEI